jgi:hypothetical protein
VYLEIHRWHHMTPSFHLNPPATPPGLPPPRPGPFLLSARAISLAAPPAFLLLLLAVTIGKRRNRSAQVGKGYDHHSRDDAPTPQ